MQVENQPKTGILAKIGFQGFPGAYIGPVVAGVVVKLPVVDDTDALSRQSIGYNVADGDHVSRLLRGAPARGLGVAFRGVGVDNEH